MAYSAYGIRIPVGIGKLVTRMMYETSYYEVDMHLKAVLTRL